MTAMTTGLHGRRFDAMKRMNARLAFYGWVLSGCVLIPPYGIASFVSWQAALFFFVGALIAVHVIGFGNFMLQRVSAIALQTAVGRPSSFAVRFINGFGIGLLSANLAAVWILANYAVTGLFGPRPF